MEWCRQLCVVLLQGLVVSITRVVDLFGSIRFMSNRHVDVFSSKLADVEFMGLIYFLIH